MKNFTRRRAASGSTIRRIEEIYHQRGRYSPRRRPRRKVPAEVVN